MYKHTQTGGVMILSAIGMLAAGVAADTVARSHIVLYLLAAMAAFLYFGFRELTVEVGPEAVKLRFGTGLITKKFKLRDIVSARAVRSSWWWGWGVKYIGDGWLYNVSGRDAVELVLTDGRRARIGTDEPQVLEREISSRLSAR